MKTKMDLEKILVIEKAVRFGNYWLVAGVSDGRSPDEPRGNLLTVEVGEGVSVLGEHTLPNTVGAILVPNASAQGDALVFDWGGVAYRISLPTPPAKIKVEVDKEGKAPIGGICSGAYLSDQLILLGTNVGKLLLRRDGGSWEEVEVEGCPMGKEILPLPPVSPYQFVVPTCFSSEPVILLGRVREKVEVEKVAVPPYWTATFGEGWGLVMLGKDNQLHRLDLLDLGSPDQASSRVQTIALPMEAWAISSFGDRIAVTDGERVAFARWGEGDWTVKELEPHIDPWGLALGPEGALVYGQGTTPLVWVPL